MRPSASRLRSAFAISLCVATLSACAALLDVKDIYLDEAAGGEGGSGGEGGGGNDGALADGADPFDANTCNADLETDPKNCGACGHDCTDGTCTDGVCELAKMVFSPTDLAVRGPYVYVSYQGGTDGVFKCPVNGCASAAVGRTELAPEDASFQPFNLVVNDTFAYAADYYGFNQGGVLRFDVNAVSMTRLPSAAPGLERSYSVALDNGSVYWTINNSNGGVSWCALPDCAGGAKDATASDTPTVIAVAPDGTIVWGENGGYELRKCTSKTACNPVTVATFLGVVNDISIDSGTIYWSTSRGQIFSCALTGCANPTVVIENLAWVAALAVSNGTLYFANMDKDDGGNVLDKTGTIKSCPVNGCSGAIRTIAIDQVDPVAIALDDKSVYWANSGAFGLTSGIGNILKAPR